MYKKMKLEGLKIYPFMDICNTITQECNIATTNKPTSDVAARRIAIVTKNGYLKCEGNIHYADLLERQIYEAVKMLNLTCDPIPEEIRAKKMGWSRKEFDPLKLSIEGEEKYLTTYTPLVAIIIRKLNTAKKR